MMANALESPLRESTAREACTLARRASKRERAARTIVIALPGLPAGSRGDALIDAANLDVEKLLGSGQTVPAGIASEIWTAENGILNHALGSVPTSDRPAVLATLADCFRRRFQRSLDPMRPVSLAALVPFADADQAEEYYEEAIADADRLLADADPHDDVSLRARRRKDALDAVIPSLPTSRLKAFLRTHGRIEDTAELASAMAAYAPSSGFGWDRAVAQARAVKAPAGAPALAELAAAAKDGALLTEALDEAASAVQSGKPRFRELAVRVCARQDWSGALAVARRADDEGELGDILAEVARKAPLDLAPDIADFATSVSDALGRAEALLALGERLDGEDAKTATRAALDAALAAARAGTWTYVEGVWIGAVALAALNEGLDDHESERLAREVLAAIEGLDFLGVTALAGMAPHLPLSLLGKATEIARSMRGRDAPAALAAIASVSPSHLRSEIFAEAWKLAVSLPSHEQAAALGAMADALPDAYRERVVSTTLELEDTAFARALIDGVATVLPGRQVERVLERARNWNGDKSVQAEALGAIARRLAVLGRADEAIDAVTGLSTALQGWDDSPQTVAAKGLPTVFAELGQWEHAARAAELVAETNEWNDRVRDDVLGEVTARLARKDAVTALLAARQIVDPTLRGQALQTIAGKLAVLPRDQLRAPWADALSDISRGTRPALLLALTALQPVARALDHDVGEATTLAIHDIARWWP
jgi:hypothetical protein